MSKSDYTEYIARISKGKDSLKMLDVIWTRGLPLDRITTTDVWATDTVPAWLPPMQEFMDRMDEWIWSRYHIECEHLCAMNKDGTKKTYEQMFYHVPVRRSQVVQVERENRAGATALQGARHNHRIPSEHRIQLLPKAQVCRSATSKGGLFQTKSSHGVNISNPGCRPQGFPAQISSWCKKLKIDYVRTPFPTSAPRGAGKEISWNTWVSPRTSRIASVS